MRYRTLVEFSGEQERVILTDATNNVNLIHETNRSDGLLPSSGGKEDVILVPQPSNDVNDPLRWPAWKKHLAFFNVVVFSFMVVGFASGFAPALYVLGPELHANQTQLTELITFISLAVGVTQFLWVPLAMIIGRRPVFLLSTFIFFAGIVECGVAPTYKVLLACRVLAGIGGGTSEGLGAAFINDIYFLHERGKLMGLWAFSIFAGTGCMSLIAGYMVQTIGWRWFVWLCAVIAGLNCLGFFFFFPETKFERGGEPEPSTSDELASTVVLAKPEFDHIEKVDETPISTARDLETVRYSYWQQLSLWPSLSRKYHSILSTIFRPYALIAYPVVLWGTLAFAQSISWNIAASTMSSFVFQAPPYNFEPGTQGLINIPAILGYTVGACSGGYLGDIHVRRVARRNHGVFRPESRLILLVFPAIVAPAGLIMFGLGAQFHWHWAVLFVGYGLLNATNGAAAIIASYVADTFPMIAFECLLVVNAGKNIIAFGANYGFLPWVAEVGYGVVFGTMAALYFVILLLALPFYIWDEQIKRFSASRMKIVLE